MGKEDVDIEKSITDEMNKNGVTPEKETPEVTPEVTPEDPEIEIGKGKDGNPRRVKLSEVSEWEKGHLRQEDYTKKTTELAQQRQELQELIKFADYLKTNPKKLEKVLAVLEEKVEEAKEDIATGLEGLDPNDPYAKLLKQSLEGIKRLEGKIAQYEEKDAKTEESDLVQQAQQVLTKTLGDIGKEYKFDDKEEESTWRMMVLSFLKDNPKDYKDEEDFTATIKEIGKKYYNALQKIGEVKVKKYLETKKTPLAPGKEAAGTVLKAKPTVQNLDEMIQAMADDELAKNKEGA